MLRVKGDDMKSIERAGRIDARTERRYRFMMETVQALGERAWMLIRRGDVTMQKKPDTTKVTSVDDDLNERFIEAVETHSPGDLVWGEERSNAEKNDLDEAERHWLWTIDPIDGTSNFWDCYNGGSFQRSTASIMVTGFAPGSIEPTMAVISNPFHRRPMAISTVGGRTWLHTPQTPSPLEVRGGASMPRTLASVRQYETSWWRGSAPDTRIADRIMPPDAISVDHPLSMGGVALRHVTINLFPGPSQPHDVAPGAAIVYHAGGHIRTFDGREYGDVDWRHYPVGGVVSAVNERLVDELMQRMAAETVELR